MTRFFNNLVLVLIIALLLISTCASLAAQTGSVNLKGVVWDPAGNLFKGAALTAEEEATGQKHETVSDESGKYQFLALPPGVYSVTLKAKGYKNVIHRNIALLMPGTVEQNITIEAAAVDEEKSTYETPRLNDSENSGAYSRGEIEARPLLIRNPLSQTIYQLGVQINGGNESSSTFNGARRAMDNSTMDGITITDPVNPYVNSSVFAINPESISEIQIVTLGGKAEYGHAAGGQFVLSSRRGTKSWTGNLYDFSQNSKLNANEFFLNSEAIKRPSVAGSLFGAEASGPIYKDNTLFFGNYEGERTDRQISRNRLVLTDDAKSGIFHWYAPNDPTKDSTTVKSFNIAQSDPRGIDPTIASTIALLPESNNTLIGDGLNTAGYQFNNPTYFHQDRFASRVDHTLNSDHKLFLRVNWNRTDATDTFDNADAPYLNQPYGTINSHYYGFVAGSNWTISPQKVNEFRVGFLAPSTDLNRPRTAGPMLLANSWTDPLLTSFPSSYNSKIFEAADSMSHSKGNHLLKYGLDYSLTHQNTEDYAGAYPNVTFGLSMGNEPASTIGPSKHSVISTDDRITFDKLYNDLMGKVESVTQTFNSSLTSVFSAGTAKNRSFSFQGFSGFFQDDWRIKPNLTLNLGMRLELNSVPSERNGFQSVLNQEFKLSDSADITNFQIGSGDSWYKKSLKGLAPRFGFAWNISGSGSTVLRGGYGIYYDRLIGAITNFIDSNSYGFTQNQTIYPNSLLRNGIPTIPTPSSLTLNLPDSRSSSIAVFDPNIKLPRIDQYNLVLEKRLGAAVFEVGYVGTRGRNLFQYLNLNQTKSQGDFLAAFQELQSYRDMGIPLSATNPFLKVFGSPLAALNAVGASSVDSNQLGLVADAFDKAGYTNYASAGLPDYYMRNFPQFDKFIVGSSTGNSWYNSLQTGFRASGSTYHMRFHYTWSKSLDTMSSDGVTLTTPSNSFYPAYDKAPSDFDRTHVVNFAWDQRIPFGRMLNQDSQLPKWIDAVLGNWNFGALYIWESGARYSVTSGLQTAYAGVNSYENYSGDRGVGTIQKDGTSIFWLDAYDKTFFSNPGAGETGTSGRNSFIGPSYSDLDVALFKFFPVTEKQSVQLRVEAYNVFNRVNFGLPDTNWQNSATTFGKIYSTVGTPRSFKVALKYQF